MLSGITDPSLPLAFVTVNVGAVAAAKMVRVPLTNWAAGKS